MDNVTHFIRVYALALTGSCIVVWVLNSNGAARFFAGAFGALFLLTAGWPRSFAGVTVYILLLISVIGFLGPHGPSVTPSGFALAVPLWLLAIPFAFPFEVAGLFRFWLGRGT
jgi:hypothetical protein